MAETILPLGREAKLYWNDGDWDSPSWQELDIVRDLKVNLTPTEWNASSRGSNGWELAVATMKKLTLDFQVLHRTNDAGWQALRNAAMGDSLDERSIDMLCLDGDIETTGSQGPRGYMQVFGFSDTQNMADGQVDDVSLKPTVDPEDSNHPPYWYEVV